MPTKYEFETGLAKIVDIVELTIFQEIKTLQSHNDSFFSTHHPPNPEVQVPGLSSTLILPLKFQKF